MRSLNALFFAGLYALAGCSVVSPAPPAVSVAVAVPCRAAVPERPTFPADTLTGDEDIFTTVKVLWADSDARQAYELKVEAALKDCTSNPP